MKIDITLLCVLALAANQPMKKAYRGKVSNVPDPEPYMRIQVKKQNYNDGNFRQVQNTNSHSGNAVLLEPVEYKEDGVEAYYPQIHAGLPESKKTKLNKILKDDFDNILKIYAFDPYPELNQPKNGTPRYSLKINYIVKLVNEHFISILYNVDFNTAFAAHPSEMIYTTNLNLDTEERLRLPDMIPINKAFVNEFRTWPFITFEEGNQELNNAIKDYLSNITEEELIQGFKQSDLINSENSWGIYSYLTADKLGVSLAVPHYIGDHVEFEQAYKNLQGGLQLTI
ncbi:MAG: hypothetical protein K0S47_2998 [Herbinix sp.]|nr:hypothetical protein [Herbinix sp.]